MRRELLAVLLAAAVPAHAVSTNVGTAGAEFLRLGAGARALGMGEASTAVSDGPDAAYWNPAGLAAMTRPEVLYARAELPAGVHHDYLCVAAPSSLLRGTIAFSLTRLTQDGIAQVNAGNQPRGSFAPHSEAYALSYGHQFADNNPLPSSREYFRENWNLPRVERPYEDEREPWTGAIAGGLTFKAVNENLGTRSASAFAVDGGALFRPQDMPALILAGALRNVGQKIRFISEESPLPAEVSAGAAYDARTEDWRLLPAFELDFPYAGNLYGKLGFEASREVSPGMSAAARVGYTSLTASDLGALSGLAFGVGLQAGAFRFDAAFAPMSGLGENFRLGIGWRF